MNQKSFGWDDIVKQPDGNYIKKPIVAGEKKAGKSKYNNKKVTSDGIKFDSKIEAYFYQLLKFHKVEFEMKPKWELQQAFVYNGQAVRAIGLEPDFVIKNDSKQEIAIVDTKGIITKEWKIKIKILKHNYKKEGRTIPIYLPTTQAECQKTIIQLKALLNK
jgi:hypothetical protein